MRRGLIGIATLALMASALRCTGSDPEAAPGNGTSSSSGTAGSSGTTPLDDASTAPETSLPPPGPLVPNLTIATTAVATCLLRSDGKVVCWGGNDNGELAQVPTTARHAPFVLPNLDGVARLAAGGRSFCAVLVDRTVKCWGDNTYGQLGQDYKTAIQNSAPTPIAGLEDAVDITAGFASVCALKGDRSVVCWGVNAHDELGHPRGDDAQCTDASADRCTYKPTTVANLHADGISAGVASTCALDGTKVLCWGDNEYAQLGHTPGDLQDEGCSLPDGGTCLANWQPTAALDSATRIFVGTAVACATSATNQLLCWGANSYGQAGSDAAAISSQARPVIGLPAGTMTGFDSGFSTSCAAINGELYCWGKSESSLIPNVPQLSQDPLRATKVALDGRIVRSTTPCVPLPGAHRCAVTTDEKVYCWGGNTHGESGQATGDRIDTPTLVPLP